jgi:hypothetical protein
MPFQINLSERSEFLFEICIILKYICEIIHITVNEVRKLTTELEEMAEKSSIEVDKVGNDHESDKKTISFTSALQVRSLHTIKRCGDV